MPHFMIGHELDRWNCASLICLLSVTQQPQQRPNHKAAKVLGRPGLEKIAWHPFFDVAKCPRLLGAGTQGL